MSIEVTYTPEQITLRWTKQKPGFLDRFTRSTAGNQPLNPTNPDHDLALAIADLRVSADTTGDDLTISADQIQIGHRVASMIDSKTAGVLGLPPLVDLTLKTDVAGQIGHTDFKVTYQWLKDGLARSPKRVGSMLETAGGVRRIPLFMMEALEVAESFQPGQADQGMHWEALARFRQALEPGISVDLTQRAGKISVTDFLRGLEVRLADRFALSPYEGSDGLDFGVIPFAGRSIEKNSRWDDDTNGVTEADGELDPEQLKAFGERLDTYGALPAYRLGQGSFLVIDRWALPVLEMMARVKKGPAETRVEFVRNPRPFIADVVEQSLRVAGKLEGITSPEQEEEAIELVAGPIFVETHEYSDRVSHIAIYDRPNLGPENLINTTWLPEFFEPRIAVILSRMGKEELAAVSDKLQEARSAGVKFIEIARCEIPVSDQVIDSVSVRIAEIVRQDDGNGSAPIEEKLDGNLGPIVVVTKVHFDEVEWQPTILPRHAVSISCPPDGIKTTLKDYQLKAVRWQIEAWRNGTPGILNGDDQGLGKTLQTLAFLKWLKIQLAADTAAKLGPTLIVAPTSLLQNWEQEAEKHLEERALGHLIRLYGSGLSGMRRAGTRGVDIQHGEELLDLSQIKEAIEEGRSHRFWILTTYTTLTNYQHSLASIPFSVVVFDEIQALKNPVSLRAVAARALNANFRIGLTGTPIENSTTDLWAIMDNLYPGALGSLKDFRSRYGTPEEGNMSELHKRVFHGQGSCPPIGIRRMKSVVAADLPAKRRCLQPRKMPPEQAEPYNLARLKLAEGAKGSALKMLHHIRSVSLHPALDSSMDSDDFVNASGRLQATFEILRAIQSKGERALVFIESLLMQRRFIELTKREFHLQHIDLINGETPIQKRQAIVNRFQQHIQNDGGFDLLVLGPKAAGTGLTLTAATHVIHLSRWWNPAVEEQCNDRVHRLGQTKDVMIHVPMAIHPDFQEHSFDCLLNSLMTRKRRLASSALWPMGDTSGDAASLEDMVIADPTKRAGDPVVCAMQAMFQRDQMTMPDFDANGGLMID